MVGPGEHGDETLGFLKRRGISSPVDLTQTIISSRKTLYHGVDKFSCSASGIPENSTRKKVFILQNLASRRK
jgi:hypothetical protein